MPPASRTPLSSEIRDLSDAVVRTIREPLLILDGAFHVRAANPIFYRTFVTEPDDTIGRLLFDLGNGQWDIPTLRTLLEHVLPGDATVEDFEVEHEFETLGWRFMLLNARRLERDVAGDDLILLAIQDMTEQKRAERELLRSNQELERYRRKLESRTRRLEQSNRDLQDFAHAASHDLQEPLRKIHVYVDHLIGALDSEALDERSRRYLIRLPDAVERMQKRIDDLLQLARISRSRPARARVALDDVVAAVVDDLEVQVRETGALIEVGKLPTVEADGAQMRVLFQNLISNALKFRKADMAPVVRIHETRGSASQSDRPVHHEIVVEDQGIGFEPEYTERIFGAFQRLHGQREYEGNGVGLALCRRITGQHGGSITATSRPGEGTRFIVTLPEAAPPEEEEGL